MTRTLTRPRPRARTARAIDWGFILRFLFAPFLLLVSVFVSDGETPKKCGDMSMTEHDEAGAMCAVDLRDE